MVRVAGGCRCWTLTREVLDERLEMVKAGATPTWADLRNFFYQCRNRYLTKYPDELELDTAAVNIYAKFLDVIKHWCEDKAPRLGIDPVLYWRVREKLNLWPEGKATCWTKDDNFLVTNETRTRVTEGCSFLLVCEKRTVSRELLQTLDEEGYRLNIIATVGHSQSDVQEAVLQVKEDLDGDTANFYILILHDYDLDGVRIYHTLKQRYNAVIDVGVNGEFIQWIKNNGDFDARLTEEKVLNKKYRRDLRGCMIKSPEYGLEDFEYLQGQPIREKRWEGRRIEIDAIHAQYGIAPFVNYILYKIEKECKVWDLSRIGVEPWELEEPTNYYEEAISELRDEVGKAYGTKRQDLSKTYQKILAIVEDTLTIEQAFVDLDKKHREEKLETYNAYSSDGTFLYSWELKTIKGEDELKDEYEEQIGKEWADDYQDRLDAINGNITKYEGDVREGEEDLEKQVKDLQDELDEAKEEDPDIEPFKEKLDEIDWGKEELIAIKITPPEEEVRSVIEALEEYLEELEAQL